MKEVWWACVNFSSLSLTSALDGGGWSTPLLGHFTPWKTQYPLYRQLDGPQERSGRVWKISSPPVFNPQALQPAASHYTNYAISGHEN